MCHVPFHYHPYMDISPLLLFHNVLSRVPRAAIMVRPASILLPLAFTVLPVFPPNVLARSRMARSRTFLPNVFPRRLHLRFPASSRRFPLRSCQKSAKHRIVQNQHAPPSPRYSFARRKCYARNLSRKRATGRKGNACAVIRFSLRHRFPEGRMYTRYKGHTALRRSAVLHMQQSGPVRDRYEAAKRRHEARQQQVDEEYVRRKRPGSQPSVKQKLNPSFRTGGTPACYRMDSGSGAIQSHSRPSPTPATTRMQHNSFKDTWHHQNPARASPYPKSTQQTATRTPKNTINKPEPPSHIITRNSNGYPHYV